MLENVRKSSTAGGGSAWDHGQITVQPYRPGWGFSLFWVNGKSPESWAYEWRHLILLFNEHFGFGSVQCWRWSGRLQEGEQGKRKGHRSMISMRRWLIYFWNLPQVLQLWGWGAEISPASVWLQNLGSYTLFCLHWWSRERAVHVSWITCLLSIPSSHRKEGIAIAMMLASTMCEIKSTIRYHPHFLLQST